MSSILKNRIARAIRGRLFKGFYSGPLGKDFEERWNDIALIADLRPTDRVLDVGCAEGLISIEISKCVAHVHGIDISDYRVQIAKASAAQSSNVTFESADFSKYTPSGKYEVTLLLSVLGKSLDGGASFGLAELAKLLAITARQSIVRVGLTPKSAKRGYPLESIFETMDACGFDPIAFPRGKAGDIIIGNRRGAGAQLKTVPRLILSPTVKHTDNPCLAGASIGSYEQFR